MRVKFLLLFFLSSPLLNGNPVKPGANLQAVLDSGGDLALEKGALYEISATLTLKADGQKIYTQGAKSVGDYARLKISSPSVSRILNMNGKENAALENIIFDGNRYAEHDIENRESLVQAGMRGGNGQTIRTCVFLNARGWSLLHIFEPAEKSVVEGCFFLGAGVDCRGGGASEYEKPFPWGDSISMAAANAAIKDNLMIDATDVGIVLFGARGSVVEENVIAAISRETLGAVNMVDITSYYENPKGSKRIDYNGVIVRKNLADGKGARIHIAFPMGRHIWGPGKSGGKDGYIVEGATVEENETRGLCMGYGFAMHGVENFKVRNNISYASYSRPGDGLSHKRPDDPCAFIYDAETVKNCELQEEFQTSKETLVHLLACNFGKRRSNGEGWRMYQYGASESIGAVKTAYGEMLGRTPNAKELEDAIVWLDATKYPVDELRLKLIATEEFTRKNGRIDAKKLHEFRTEKWIGSLEKIQKRFLNDLKRLPSAKEAYNEIWKDISNGN